MAKRTAIKPPAKDSSAGTTKGAQPIAGENGIKPAPIEHDHGEPGAQPGIAGSVEEETLDPDAPYNKTYGRELS